MRYVHPVRLKRLHTDDTQLAQDDDGFEIRSMADSLDDEEEGRMPGDRTPVPNGAAARDASPMPGKPAPMAPPVNPRESLDGETIFAVGEDGDRWSDDESPRNSSERKRLTSKDA